MLLGRSSEREALDRVLADVRTGGSRALVMRGDAGIGKTALLDYLVGQAVDCRTVRVAGLEAEKELAFAALHQICAPLLDRLGHLPAPQQDALRTAFGLTAGSRPDHFKVGLAVLGLFAEAAREQPVLCVVDDAQWLDQTSAQVVGFAARRLRAESVAVVFAVRETGDHAVPELVGLPDLCIDGLPDKDARVLLASAHPGAVDDRVLERIVAESQGNPLALLELPRGFTAAELAGGFGLLSATAVPRRIEESFRRQIAAISPTTRQVLLVAAAEPVGDPVLVWRAVGRLDVGMSAAGVQEAEAAGLVEFASRVRFRHPLLRSVIYSAASPEQRRRVHAALADAVDPLTDPDRRAWHLAQAADDTDEDVAAELERCGGRAQARGGLAAAVAFFERASELSPDPAIRGRRALAAAQAGCLASMPETSVRLLAVAEASPLGALQNAEADLLRARLAFDLNRGPDATSLLLKAATQLEGLDPALARDTYLEALRAAWYAGDPPGGITLRDAAKAAAAAPEPEASPRPSDLLLDGLTVRYTAGYAVGAPALKQVVHAFRAADFRDVEALRWLWFASATAVDLCDDEAADELTSGFVELARSSGALAPLALALTTRIVVAVFSGDLAGAGAMLDELNAVEESTGLRIAPYAAQLLAAWRGQEDVTTELVSASTLYAKRRTEGLGPINSGWARAVLANGLGCGEEAFVAAQRAVEPSQERGVLTWAPLVELVTAASRTGRSDVAADALQRLEQLTRASGSQWALGLAACCRALVSDGPAAENSYLEAIDRLGRTRIRGQLARTHLHYGEWLRRHNRRNHARDQLRTAHEMLTTMGMDGFAALAARELGATGETVRKQVDASSARLTGQEAQIVRLVRDGLSNAEIATRLFISPRTVEWHISKIFAKLGISSRRQLRR
jgi:DNA-binding CsgD family transcriptional regulator/tetratricopeptide (TPR) repeat protein